MKPIKQLKRQNIEKVIITLLVLSMTVIACNISSAKESTVYGEIGKWISDGKTSVIVYSMNEDTYFNPVTGDLNPMYVIKFQIKNPTDYNISIKSFVVEIYHPDYYLPKSVERSDKKPFTLLPGGMLPRELATTDTDGYIFPSKPTKFGIQIHLEDMGTSTYIISLIEAEPTPMVQEKEKKGIPSFGGIFAIICLSVAACFALRRKIKGKRKW
jgi:hypothetical protein